MAVEFEDHPFWDFSLAVYGATGVSDRCIALQDRRGIDVNLLLFCAWNGASGRGRLTAGELAVAIEAVGAWNREVVCGLRAVRRWMREAQTGVARSTKDVLRRQIIAIEVQCEHAEQLALARAVERPERAMLDADRRAGDAAANCVAYFRHLGAPVDDADRDDLAIILAAAFPTAGREAILGMLKASDTGGAPA